MADSFSETRSRLETYFDQTATKAWEQLTSDAPVSRIRQTVRRGRDAMRQLLLSYLPNDLKGARILDAGCGTGAMTVELAGRGASVVAVDISPKLVGVAQKRLPGDLSNQVEFSVGDMLDPDRGCFDHIVAMDSLIHYNADDISQAVDGLGQLVANSLLFTIAPRTPLLTAMHVAGKLLPRSDRSPAIVPVRPKDIEKRLKGGGSMAALRTIKSGFYFSKAMEFRP